MPDTAPPNILKFTRSVPFGYCDPAGIIYTPRALDICLEAIDDFLKTVLDGRGWYEMNVHLDRGTPFVNINLNFTSPVTGRSPIDVMVELERLGNSSVTFRVRTSQEGRDCFDASLTTVLVVTSKMAKVDHDDWLRQELGRVAQGK